jgi:type IV pilus assembly protein PilN
MKIRLNLATHPYEDASKFYQRWLGSMGALFVLAIVLCWLSYQRYQEFGFLRANLETTLRINAELDAEKAKALNTLNQEVYRDTRDQAAFLNGVFLRKSFSWTQTMQDMESIVPKNVQVVSLSPTLVPTGDPKTNSGYKLEVKMEVSGVNREDVIVLLQNLEDSPHFADARLVAETDKDTEKKKEAQFNIVVEYVRNKQSTKNDAPKGAL